MSDEDMVPRDVAQSWKAKAENLSLAYKAQAAEIVKLREAVSILEDALQEAGDDYPGSKMQEWCQYMISCARAAMGETK